MAEKSRRRIKPAETIRQKTEKASQPNKKPRRIKSITSSASSSLRATGSWRTKHYHPLPLPDNRIGRFLSKPRSAVPRFFREAWQELRQVAWPNRRETAKLTVAVIIFAIIFGALIAATDYGLEKLFRELLDLN